MSGSNSAISRRRLLKGAGAMWLLSVSQVGLAATSQVVAVRVWPSSTYTRVTVESNRVLKYKQFALSNPERVVVDLEGVNLNSVLKGMAAQIRGDDPFIKSARVGQFDPQTVRMVFELKQNVKPQLFALAPVATFKERLVMDLYPANATDIQDPLLALLEDYNKEHPDAKTEINYTSEEIGPMLLNVDNGKYDYKIFETQTIKTIVKEQGLDNIKIRELDLDSNDKPYVYFVFAQDQKDLQTFVNKRIKTLYDNGTLEKLSKKFLDGSYLPDKADIK